MISPDPTVPIIGFDAERDVDADPEFDVLLQPEGILQIEQAVQRSNDVPFGRVSPPVVTADRRTGGGTAADVAHLQSRENGRNHRCHLRLRLAGQRRRIEVHVAEILCARRSAGEGVAERGRALFTQRVAGRVRSPEARGHADGRGDKCGRHENAEGNSPCEAKTNAPENCMYRTDA